MKNKRLSRICLMLVLFLIVGIMTETSLWAGIKPSWRMLFQRKGTCRTTEHGKRVGFIIPYDAKVDLRGDDVMDYEMNAISLDNLAKFAYDMKAKHVVLLLDSCFSGLVLKSRGFHVERKLNRAYYETRLRQKAINLLTAGDDQPISDGHIHSPFTRSLLNALEKGSLDMNDQDGLATFNELAEYVREKVSLITDGRQKPQFDNWSREDGEFVFRFR